LTLLLVLSVGEILKLGLELLKFHWVIGLLRTITNRVYTNNALLLNCILVLLLGEGVVAPLIGLVGVEIHL
jgi:hypothetical protein